MIKKIKRFGESDSNNQWYELDTGERIKCDESIINTLWFDWVIRTDVHRKLVGDEIIFEYNKPVEIDLP